MFQLLEDMEEDDMEIEPDPIEPNPIEQDPIQNQRRNVIASVKYDCWMPFDGSTSQLGLVNRRIPCGTVEFEGDKEKRDCSFAIYADDKVSRKRIKMMANIRHPNLLNAMVFARFDVESARSDESSEKTRMYNELSLDRISGTFEKLLATDVNVFFNQKSHVFSDCLLMFLRGLINAVAFVHHKGFYHGGVQNKNILYHKINDDYKFLLANYQGSEDKNVPKRQTRDWHALGRGIESIQTAYIVARKKRKDKKGEDISGSNVYQDFIVAALNDLIKILKNAKEEELVNIKEMALNSIPFQSPHDRQRYMAVVVPALMSCSETYCRKLDSKWNTFLKKKPWTSDDLCYLSVMNDYRMTNNENFKPYDGASGKAFIKYVSGVYTHYHEFKDLNMQRTDLYYVDDYFRETYPTLFPALKDIEEEVFLQRPPVS